MFTYMGFGMNVMHVGVYVMHVHVLGLWYDVMRWTIGLPHVITAEKRTLHRQEMNEVKICESYQKRECKVYDGE